MNEMESENRDKNEQYADGQLGMNNEQHESKDRIEIIKEDESKTLRSNDRNDMIATGQNFFNAPEHSEDLMKFEEEKEEELPPS